MLHAYISTQKPEPSESFLYLQTTFMKSAFSPFKPCSQYSLCHFIGALTFTLLFGGNRVNLLPISKGNSWDATSVWQVLIVGEHLTLSTWVYEVVDV